jgi:hypothetical protein
VSTVSTTEKKGKHLLSNLGTSLKRRIREVFYSAIAAFLFYLGYRLYSAFGTTRAVIIDSILVGLFGIILVLGLLIRRMAEKNITTKGVLPSSSSSTPQT